MIEMIDQTSKALIYSDERILLGKAVINCVTVDDSISLIVDDEVLEQMQTSFILTLTNDAYGLVSYKAEIETFRRESYEHGTYVVVVRPVEFIERIQRRENFKIKVTIPITAYFGSEEYEAEIKDISASGVLIAIKKEAGLGERFDSPFE